MCIMCSVLGSEPEELASVVRSMSTNTMLTLATVPEGIRMLDLDSLVASLGFPPQITVAIMVNLTTEGLAKMYVGDREVSPGDLAGPLLAMVSLKLTEKGQEFSTKAKEEIPEIGDVLRRVDEDFKNTTPERKRELVEEAHQKALAAFEERYGKPKPVSEPKEPAPWWSRNNN